MERLNLYSKKIKKVSLKTLIAFLLIMTLPAIAGRIFLEMHWKHTIGRIKAEHAEILDNLKVDIHGGMEDLLRIENLTFRFNQSYQILAKQRKDIIDFLKEAYSSKRVLSMILNSISKDEENWMILTDFRYSEGKIHLVAYEIYSDMRKSDEIARKLGEIGLVRKSVLFDVDMSGEKRMSKVVIDYAPR